MNSKGILTALLMLLVLLGCGPEKTRTIPEELLGTWKTSEPKYADTFIELMRDSIIFGLAEGPPKVHPVLAVEKSRENGNLLYTILYLDEERERYKFSFYYYPAGRGNDAVEESAGHPGDEAEAVVGDASPHATDGAGDMVRWSGRRGKRR